MQKIEYNIDTGSDGILMWVSIFKNPFQETTEEHLKQSRENMPYSQQNKHWTIRKVKSTN